MSSRPVASLEAPLVQSPTSGVRATLSRGARALHRLLTELHQQFRSVFPSQETLARHLECSVRSVRNYLTELRAAGLVETEPRGRYASLLYRLLNMAARKPKRKAKPKPNTEAEVSDRQDLPPIGSQTRSGSMLGTITRTCARCAARSDDDRAAERAALATEIVAIRQELAEMGAGERIVNPGAYRTTLRKQDAETLTRHLAENRAQLEAAKTAREAADRPEVGAYVPPPPSPEAETWEALPETVRKDWKRRAFERLRASGMWAQVCEAFTHLPNFPEFRHKYLCQQAKDFFCAMTGGSESPEMNAESAPLNADVWETLTEKARKEWKRRAFNELKASGMWFQLRETFSHLPNFREFRHKYLCRQGRELFERGI
jgi:biotin operon repressor